MENLKRKNGVLEDYLLKNEKNNMSKVVKEGTKNSKFASLDYEVLKYDKEIDLSVLKINLHTGRHHQIRVQFSHRQHPLVGDVLYGGSHYNQLMLYAYEISFYHPITNNRLIFNKIPTSELWDQFLK